MEGFVGGVGGGDVGADAEEVEGGGEVGEEAAFEAGMEGDDADFFGGQGAVDLLEAGDEGAVRVHGPGAGAGEDFQREGGFLGEGGLASFDFAEFGGGGAAGHLEAADVVGGCFQEAEVGGALHKVVDGG